MHGNIVTEMTQSMSVLRSPCTVTLASSYAVLRLVSAL